MFKLFQFCNNYYNFVTFSEKRITVLLQLLTKKSKYGIIQISRTTQFKKITIKTPKKPELNEAKNKINQSKPRQGIA